MRYMPVMDDSGNEKSGLSVFDRKRLPRHDPHLWADRLEDWFARLTAHVGTLYVLLAIVALYAARDDIMKILNAIGRSFYGQ